jgi:RHS repeat-associated protein
MQLRGLSRASYLALSLFILAAAAPAGAQTCNQCPGTPLRVGMCGTPDIVHTGAGCSFNYCQNPQVASSPTFDILPQPDGTYIARMVVQVTAPWNQTAQQSNPNGTLDLTWFDTATAPTPWTSGGNPSLCEYLASDRVNTYVEKTGLTCDGAPYDFGTYSLRASMCGGPCPPPFFPSCGSFCGRWVDKGGYQFQVTKQMLSCPQPKKHDCDNCSSCLSVGGAGGKGGGSKGGGPGYAAPGDSGPGAFLRYAASGVGGPGFPGTAAWKVVLGRYWSHDYAERIVLDPSTNDDSHVWLLTRTATFREFSKTGTGPGLYTTVTTGDEYRKLSRTATGWQLAELDGTVHGYDAAGRWTSTVDPNGNAKQGTYDPTSGLLTRVTFPDARREDFGYNAAHRLTSITEVGVDLTTSRTWSYTWTGDDLTRIDRPDGTALEFFYQDAVHAGYLTRMDLVAAGGGRRVEVAWEYDATGNMAKLWRGDTSFAGADAADRWSLAFDNPVAPVQASLTDALGKTSTYTFARDLGSGKPKVTAITGDCPACGLGPNSLISYDDPANPLRPTRQIDGRGTSTLFAYDANGLLIAKTEAAGTALERTTTYQRGGPFPSLITREEKPSTSGTGVRATVSSFSSQGNPLTRTDTGLEAGSTFSYATTTTFNGAGRPTSIDPPGYAAVDQTTFTYDASRGGLIMTSRTDPLIGATTYGYDPFNRPTSLTDVNAVATETTYDPLNRTLTLIRRGATTAEDLVTSYTRNGFGDVVRVTMPAGNVVEYGYDSAGRMVSVERKPDPATPGERTLFTLDRVGHRTRQELQAWNGTGWEVKSSADYGYTSRCQLDKAINADGTATEYAYDCNGNLAKVWDAAHPSAGQTAVPAESRTYDLLDRLAASIRPWGGAGGGTATTSYAYDVQDHPVQVTDATGTVSRYTVSDRGLLTQELSEVAGTMSYTYNEHGRQVSRTDGRGVTVNLTVDPLDRTTFVDYPDNSLDVTQVYDGPGANAIDHLTSVRRNGQNVDFAYDRFGRVVQDGGLTYSYDKNGNRLGIGYPGGVSATYTYDFADRQATLSLRDGTGPLQTVAGSSSYLPEGPLAQLTLGNGLAETRAFNQRYLPTAIQVAGRLDWSYSNDAAGNVTAIADNLNAAASRTYGYQDYQYYLTQGDGPWGTRSWSYDRIGNRLSETRDGVADSYVYTPNAATGSSPRLSRIVQGGGAGNADFFYDAAGNMTFESKASEKLRLSYDSDQRLSQLRGEAPNGREGLSQLTYDGRGYLASASLSFLPGATSPQEEAAATYSSQGLLYHRAHLFHRGPGTPRGVPEVRDDTYVFYFAGRPVALYQKKLTTPATGLPATATTLTFLTTDHLGTPVLATSASGVAVWSGGFEPFGRDWNGAQAAGVFLRLPGQWEDATWETGAMPNALSYNVNRWYDDATGRYASADPLVLQRALDPYVYALDRPLHYIDSLGLSSCGPLPQRPDFPTCLGFCEGQKRWAECALDKELFWIGVGGVGLALIAGVGASFEFTPVGGALVFVGVVIIDIAIHHAWESAGKGRIEGAYNRCVRDCNLDACLIKGPGQPGGACCHPV